MSVEKLANQLSQKGIEMKKANEVALEQQIKKLEEKLEQTIKVIENMAMRIDNLEFELYRGK